MSELIVMRDGFIDRDFHPEPTIGSIAVEATQSFVQAVGQRFSAVLGNVALETRIAVHDHLHGTNYGPVRRELLQQRREAAFIASIGLVKK